MLLRTAVTSATAIVALITPSTTAVAAGDGIPRGTTYWLSSGQPWGDLTAVRLKGDRINIGNALAPCFTGIRVASGLYRGGGYSQGGQYMYNSVHVKVRKDVLRFRYADMPKHQSLVYYRVTKQEAIPTARHYGSRNLKRLFIDCELR